MPRFECPIGEYYNTALKRCVRKDSGSPVSLDFVYVPKCREGFEYNPSTGFCEEQVVEFAAYHEPAPGQGRLFERLRGVDINAFEPTNVRHQKGISVISEAYSELGAQRMSILLIQAVINRISNEVQSAMIALNEPVRDLSPIMDQFRSVDAMLTEVNRSLNGLAGKVGNIKMKHENPLERF